LLFQWVIDVRGLRTNLVDFQREFAIASWIAKNIQAGHVPSHDLLSRAQFALRQTTGFARADDPNLWDKEWIAHTESYSPPVSFERTMHECGVVMVRYASCFPAGTPVLTQTGSVPIESIKPGDRLLAQDAATGELAY